MDVKPRKQIICNPCFEHEIKLVRLKLNSNSQYFAISNLLLQRLESSRDQVSGYTKMVLILSNVVNVKIKDILSSDYSLEGIPTAC